MDKPKISRKGVEEMIKILESGEDPTSKKIRKIKREAQKNVMKMFSVDGNKSDNNNE
ncbi:hypothetical protein [Paenibacillus pini]|uniref:Uncharacterized protein n=1 Tax=Paenibacillus pini JCM 16418 TaxID=1236976 RepID=W7YQM2_9BACL|nr:hypothetical protein [Paenibacillus pini]GAF10857.1 hypothetical protein JCM16418_5084 [Paenibacillus pini JCM 16418]